MKAYGKLMVLHINKYPGWESFDVEVLTNAYGDSLQRAIREETGIRRRYQQLWFRRLRIDPDQPLSHYGIREGTEITLEVHE